MEQSTYARVFGGEKVAAGDKVLHGRDSKHSTVKAVIRDSRGYRLLLDDTRDVDPLCCMLIKRGVTINQYGKDVNAFTKSLD